MRAIGMLSVLVIMGMALAQDNAPIGIQRGDLVGWNGTERAGELTFRNAQNHVYQCSYDERTYFERGNQRINVTATRQDDRVEILSDVRLGSSACYARTVQILMTAVTHTGAGARPQARYSASSLTSIDYAAPIVPFRYRSSLSASPGTSELFPRGDLTFAGVVLRLDADRVVVRLRNREHKIIQLRSDTRFLTSGQTAERASLPISTRVFIRAGRNLDNVVEAYQIIWGDILLPY